MSDQKAHLYIFSGLPGSGKSTLAKLFAEKIGAAYLRIDTIEQGLRDLCNVKVEGEGYRLSYRIAEDNLKLGINVIADSCNPIELSRTEWRDVATKSGALPIDIEITCSDKAEHKLRVENRVSEIKDLKQPSWQDVQDREYDPWTTKRILIDTAGKKPEQSLAELCAKLA